MGGGIHIRTAGERFGDGTAVGADHVEGSWKVHGRLMEGSYDTAECADHVAPQAAPQQHEHRADRLLGGVVRAQMQVEIVGDRGKSWEIMGDGGR